MRVRFGFVVALSLIFVALSSGPGMAAEISSYTIVNIGLDGSGVGINERGQVIINRSIGGRSSAVVWDNARTTPLGPLPGDTSSTARAINEWGQVVGVSSGDNSSRHAVVWANGSVTALPTPPGASFSEASGINRRGQIVGQAGGRAVLWDNGRITDLGTLPGDSYSEAVAINDAGQIVGSSVGRRSPDFPEFSRAVLWDRGTITLLGAAEYNAGSFERSVATSINNRGQVIGYSDFHAIDSTGVLWENGTMTALPELHPGLNSAARAYGINNRGQIIGAAIPSGFGDTTHAVLWENGSVVDLGPVPGSSSSGSDAGAWGINERGQIVGEVNQHAVLWERAP